MESGEIARGLAETLRARAGDGWTTAVLQLNYSPGGMALDGWTDTATRVRTDGAAIARLFWRSGAEYPAGCYEVVLRRSGEYRFTMSDGIATISPARFDFDPAFRLPNHPAPGMPLPAAAQPSGAPTDPVVLARITELTTEFAERYTALVGQPPGWEPGADEAEIAAVEARIGARLPEDVRALYRIANGDPETGLLGPYAHLPLASVLQRHDEFGVSGSGSWDDDGVIFETQPAGTVKRLSRNDWWITFAGDFAGNLLAVDLDPAELGRSGQVLEYGRDVFGPLRHVAASVTDMLAEVVEALRAGRYEVEPGEYLRPETDLDESPYRSYDQVVNRLADLATIDDPELVQDLTLNDPGALDLTALAPLKSLRSLTINGAQSVVADLSGLPLLESLEMTTPAADLTAAAGHPALWHLRLSGTGHPVGVDALLALPRLARLSLAGVDVPDVDRLGELPALRVLTLDAAQVERVLQAGKPFPAIATLTVSGRMSLSDALALRERITGVRPERIETTGTLDQASA